MRTCPNSYAWTSPYGGFWVEHFYSHHFLNLYGKKIVREAQFRKLLSEHSATPEILLMGNFVLDRAGIVGLAREHQINTCHGEDGFFPHYSTMHVDPLGFCWESSLTRMPFRALRDHQRMLAQSTRRRWLARPTRELPDTIVAPYVVWPLQLLGDRVNRVGLRAETWSDVIIHFRDCLPKEIQLVIKEHPRGSLKLRAEIEELVKRLENTIFVQKKVDLFSLFHGASAVAGANSTALYEARLMFQKPVYVYADSWFSNHAELFQPVWRHDRRDLSRLEWLEDNSRMQTERLVDYADWFLFQLLARQIDRATAQNNPRKFKQIVTRMSYDSFIQHGEDVFEGPVQFS